MDSNNHIVANNEQTLEHIASNVKGSVKWFHRIKGFGFITRDDTKEDIFVHYSGIKQDPMQPETNKRRNKRRLNLMDNEKCVFDIVKNGNQLEARDVVGRNGSLIIDLIAFKRGIAPFNLEIVNEQRLSGKVKWFNVKSRYGYVECDYNNEDVYVHANAIIHNNPNKYKPSLHDGELVEFDLLKRRDGKLEAVNVSGPNGNPVQGSEYSPDKTDKTKQPYTETNLSGRVKWFNLKEGYGYITRNDNSQDIYVHYSSIKSKNPNHRLRSLDNGETVLFNLIDGNKGPEAVDVTGPNGNPVQGSQYVRQRRSEMSGERGGQQRMPRSRSSNKNIGNVNENVRGRPRSNRMQAPPQQQQPPNRMMNRQRPGPAPGPNGNPNIPRQRRNNINKSYNKNPYNNDNFYNNDEPLYYTFKPKSKPGFYDGDSPNQSRRIPFDKYVNMVNRPQNNRRSGPPMQQPPMMRNQAPVDDYQPGNNMVLIQERLNGRVKWYNFKNAFGFVTRFDNGQDVFVHRSGIKRTFDGMTPSLDDGELVEFDLFQDGGRMIAMNVTGPSGNVVKGSKYAAMRSPIQTKVYRRRRVAN